MSGFVELSFLLRFIIIQPRIYIEVEALLNVHTSILHTATVGEVARVGVSEWGQPSLSPATESALENRTAIGRCVDWSDGVRQISEKTMIVKTK